MSTFKKKKSEFKKNLKSLNCKKKKKIIKNHLNTD